MEACCSFGAFSRIVRPLVTLFTKRVAPPAPVRRDAERAGAAMPPFASAPMSVAPSVVQPPAAPAEIAPGPAKPMRTLAEVRADLARLREKSRERQAQARVARPEVAFAATDFMDYLPSAPTRHEAPAGDESFAPTAYIDFTVLKSR